MIASGPEHLPFHEHRQKPAFSTHFESYHTLLVSIFHRREPHILRPSFNSHLEQFIKCSIPIDVRVVQGELDQPFPFKKE